MRLQILLPLAAIPLFVVPQATPSIGTAQPASHKASTPAPVPLGYFRFPALAGNELIFTAEGDLWRVDIQGGTAERLTTHPAEESHAAISPDGKTLAYSAAYEGPTEVYTMPLAGGVPTRRTYEGANAAVVGWTPDGKILYATQHFSTLPNTQLATIDPTTNATTVVPLAQASDGAYTGDGALIFTRLPFQGSHTRLYHGGTAQQLWRYDHGAGEAVPLTGDYAGTSKNPMIWQDRVYFLSDRDGTMNLWSMNAHGGELKQLTHNTTFDAQSASLSDGRIAYQLGADLHIYDIASGNDRVVPITLVSDFDQTRDRWVKSPTDWIGSAELSPSGDRIVFTARGDVFVVPVKQGRIVDATPTAPVRYRDASFFPDGTSLLTLSDQSGEFEFWQTPADGIGSSTQLTKGATVLRWAGVPSPDGAWMAHYDKNLVLWLHDMKKGTDQKITTGTVGDFGNLSWSPDGKWLAYSAPDSNQLTRLYLYSIASGLITPLTNDRYDSSDPTWSRDGKWLYFLSSRHFASLIGEPWGSRAPQPFFDRQEMIYAIPLQPGERSPFAPADELHPATPPKDTSAHRAADTTAGAAPTVTIDLDGIVDRLQALPVDPGNYSSLSTDGKRLYVMSRPTDPPRNATLMTIAIDNNGKKPETFLDAVNGYQLSLDGKKVMVQKGKEWFVFDAGDKAPTDQASSKVDLSKWSFHLDPRQEWHQEFIDAWRMERDYFYDRNMNGVDWNAMRQRFEPLVDRITDRDELSDILAQMVNSLESLHIFVYGGDLRFGSDNVFPATLGAALSRDPAAGGVRVDHIYRTDPNDPGAQSPLAKPGVAMHDGDVIESVNGIAALAVPDVGELLRDQAGRQVRLHVKSSADTGRDVIVTPITPGADGDLRYAEWEYTRREMVDSTSHGDIGYVHLRAMSTGDINQWDRDFFPVFDRAGLIIDVRHNRGGNIDSWILGQLLRRAWFFWQSRVGIPYWNMQEAFRGHIVVLTDQFTASDGEAFSEGFKRLGLGKVIGMRTWGGEIWLSSSNRMVDGGIATASEDAVYGPERKWLIEGHGVDPDIVVDDPPHATFLGQDAQLSAAIKELQTEIKANPVTVPPPPAYPDHAAGGGR